jgi:hypothetical protein
MGAVTSLYFPRANGQTTTGINTGIVAKRPTAVGVKAGVNIASFSDFSGRSRISGHGGLFIHYTINKNWCIQPELLFTGEGQRFYSNAVEHTYALDYLQLPVMIQYYPAPNVYVEAGPQVSVLINAQDKVDERNGHTNVKEHFTAAQLAIGVGVGLEITEQIILYGRYNFGLTDLFLISGLDDHSRVGQIGIAVRLNH